MPSKYMPSKHMPSKTTASSTGTARQPWSPYRRDEVVVQLPEDREDWDPVMKVEYLTTLEEPAPADSLVLETRHHAIAATQIAVDIRRRLEAKGSAGQ